MPRGAESGLAHAWITSPNGANASLVKGTAGMICDADPVSAETLGGIDGSSFPSSVADIVEEMIGSTGAMCCSFGARRPITRIRCRKPAKESYMQVITGNYAL